MYMEIDEFYKDVRYSDFRPQNQPKKRDLLTIYEIEQSGCEGRRILEIGAGSGYILRHLPDCEKHAVELSKNAAQYLETQGIATMQTDVSATPLPYEKSEFDFVIFNEIIEHLFDPQFAVNEIYRVLKTGGRLLLHTHNTFNLFMRLKFLSGKIPSGAFDVTGKTKGEHIRLFNYPVLTRVLRRGGFEKLTNKTWTSIGGKPVHLPDFLTPLFGHYFFIIAEK
jgi:SAM-dependent methyltransferase